MKKLFLIVPFLLLMQSQSLYGQSQTAQTELTQLLHRFMKGASENDAEIHDRFWAEDLIYTSSSGQRFGKAQIMAGFEETGNETASEKPGTVYTAEDIQIQVYDDMAIIAFRLVGKTETAKGTQTDHYLNSGTFIKRDGQWRAVNWQATKIPDN